MKLLDFSCSLSLFLTARTHTHTPPEKKEEKKYGKRQFRLNESFLVEMDFVRKASTHRLIGTLPPAH